jgi:hypothetical protein
VLEGERVKYEVVFIGAIKGLRNKEILPEEIAEAALDSVMEHLVDLNAIDPSISLTSAAGDIEVTVAVQAEAPDEANQTGSGIIRTALHAAEIHTPGWTVDWCEVRARRAEQLTLA